jgi:hypothetical protein
MSRISLTAFPDLHFELRDKVAQGDLVAVSCVDWHAQRTPRTPSGATLPATNKKVNGQGGSFYASKTAITSSAIHWDMATPLSQLGLMPGM